MRFESFCHRSDDDACRNVLREALGFVAGGMFRELREPLATCARRLSEKLSRLFWHGVGRAMYFAPTSAMPLVATRRRVLDEVIGTPNDACDRTNAIAGFAWAATLVNLRDPIVLEPLVEDARHLGISVPFARGIHDALAAWRQCAPGDECASLFRSHNPQDRDRRNAWQHVINAAGVRTTVSPGDLFEVPPERSRE
jgi:hypothetical protein